MIATREGMIATPNWVVKEPGVRCKGLSPSLTPNRGRRIIGAFSIRRAMVAS